MRVLALDTTTRSGSVAIVDDDRVVMERAGDAARPHAERLPGDLIHLLNDAGVPLRSIDVFAVGAGPGAFTGLRTGIATMQGLAFVQGRPLLPVSALEALAHIAAREVTPGTIVAVWTDAHRGDVFSSLYRVTDAPPFDPERLVEIDAAAVGDPAATLARWKAFGPVSVIIGDGGVAYGGLLDSAVSVIAAPPLAGAIGRMAFMRARSGQTGEPSAAQPLYIRRPDVEIERERKALIASPTTGEE